MLGLFRVYTAALILLFIGLPGHAWAKRDFIDSAGRHVTLPDKVDRAIAAGPPGSVLLYVLAPDKMVGWVREPADAEKAFLLPQVRDLPAYGSLTGKGSSANIETILALKPDVIIDVGSVNDTYVSLADRIQAQSGVPYVLIDGSFRKSAETLRMAGEVLGVPEQAGQLADEAKRILEDVERTRSAIAPEASPAVYLARGADGLETGLGGSINTEIVEVSGGRNVASAAGKGSLTSVSREQLLAWNPDVVLTQDEGFRISASKDPFWSSLNAVHRGRLLKAPTVPFGWIDHPPGINRLIGALWLSREFKTQGGGIAVGPQVRSFYKLFYHIDLTDAQVRLLLNSNN